MILKVNGVAKIEQIPILIEAGANLIKPNAYAMHFEHTGLDLVGYNKMMADFPPELLCFSLDAWEETDRLLEQIQMFGIHAKYLEINTVCDIGLLQQLDFFKDIVLQQNKRLITSGLLAEYDFPENIAANLDVRYGDFEIVKHLIEMYECVLNPTMEDAWNVLSRQSLAFPEDELQVSDIIEALEQAPIGIALNFNQTNLTDIYHTFHMAKGFIWTLDTYDDRYGHFYELFSYEHVLKDLQLMKHILNP